MTNERTPDPQPDYEAPQIEELPAEDGPAVTAAGDSPPSDVQTPGAEWRPEAGEGDEPYEAPKVEELPAEDGPAVTAAGDSPPSDESDSL